MPVILIEVDDTAVILNADEIIQIFGLEDGEVPLISGGTWTPGANSILLTIAHNKDMDTDDTNQQFFDKTEINFADGKLAFKDLIFMGGEASRQSNPLTPFPPFLATRQLALITDNSATSSVMYSYIKVKGAMLRREQLERLADRRRMHYAPGPGVAGHIMNAGLRNRMGDIPSGF